MGNYLYYIYNVNVIKAYIPVSRGGVTRKDRLITCPFPYQSRGDPVSGRP